MSKLAEEENIKDLQELKSINVDSIATMKRIQSKIITNTAIRETLKFQNFGEIYVQLYFH